MEAYDDVQPGRKNTVVDRDRGVALNISTRKRSRPKSPIRDDIAALPEFTATRLYLGNLPPIVTKKDIEEHFEKAGRGKLVDIKLMNGFGFIEYEDPRDAADVVHNFNGSEFMGNRLTVNFARGSLQLRQRVSSPPRPRRTPYRMNVSGFPPDVSWQDLKDFARRSGRDIIYSEVSRARDGTGFVEFEVEGDLNHAESVLNGSEFQGSPIQCSQEYRGPFLGFTEPIRRHRSKSDLRKPTSLAQLMTQHGGPPMPYIELRPPIPSEIDSHLDPPDDDSTLNKFASKQKEPINSRNPGVNDVSAVPRTKRRRRFSSSGSPVSTPNPHQRMRPQGDPGVFRPKTNDIAPLYAGNASLNHRSHRALAFQHHAGLPGHLSFVSYTISEDMTNERSTRATRLCALGDRRSGRRREPEKD